MANLRSSLRATEQQRQRFKQEIEAETGRLLADRAKQLARVEADASTRLQPLQTELDNLTKQRDEAKQTLIALHGDHETLSLEAGRSEQRLNSAKDAYELVRQDIAVSEQQKRELQAENVALTGKNAALTGKNADLQVANSSLLAEFEGLTAKKQQLLAEIEQLGKEYEIRQQAADEKLQIAYNKQQIVLEQIHDIDSQQKLVREDLAVRIRACDEKEKNLRMREIKVAQGEDAIQRNASLLDL